MSDAVSPHGFTVARRGYEIRQVEQAVDAVTAERDRAWQRLADLGEFSRRLEQELSDAVRAAAEAGPPDFAHLSERAVRLLALAEEEAATLRSEAEQAADRMDSRAYADAAKLTADIRTYATRLTTGADEAARRQLAWARSEAESELAEAGREARSVLEAAEAAAEEIRARAAAATRDSEAWLAGRQLAADQEQQAQEAEAAARLERATAAVEQTLAEAERYHKTMRARAADIDADAATTAERVIGAAYREAARIADASLREEEVFAEQRAELRAHLDHIRQTLTALVPAAAPDPADTAPPAPADAETVLMPAVPPTTPAPTTPAPTTPAAPAEPAAPAASAATAETMLLPVVPDTATAETVMLPVAGGAEPGGGVRPQAVDDAGTEDA